MGFSGSIFGGGGLAGGATTSTLWKSLGTSDMTLAAGNYTVSHAAGQNGFTHRITIDTGADSAYFATAQCAYLYFDTGISMATLSANKATVVSILIEFSIEPGNALGTDANARFHFGPVANNNTTLGSSTMGLHGGIIMNNNNASDFFVRCSNGLGKTGSTSTLSLDSLERGTGDNAYDYSNGDIMKSIQLTATGLGGKEAGDKFGLTGGDLIFGQTKGASGPFVHNLQEFVLRDDRRAGAGNLHIGVMFGQDTDVNGNGTAGNSKTLDFDIKYLIDSITA
jgi:hypothetical protein|tara:strand:- start:1884 stop:2726 length:843 start_codon:yes stop_codon:yes gene_type:complete